MENIKFNFLKKERCEEMYSKLVRNLLKQGYKPLYNTTYKYSFDCKQTKTSNYPSKNNKETVYPYSITIVIRHIEVEQTKYKIAA